MVEAARREAQRRGLANASFLTAPADELPFESGAYDAVVSRFGVMFFPAPLAGLCERARVLKPGGRLALSVWHFAARNPFHHLLADLVARFVEAHAPGPEALDAFRFAPPGKLLQVARAAGLAEAGERLLEFVFRKFKDGLKESPVEAARKLRSISRLFELESQAAQQKLEPAALLDLRRNRAPPILKEIEDLAREWKGTTSDAGPLAKPLTYLDNQWPVLQRFLEHGRVPIHSNSCENAIRPIAVGRKNWLFAGSVRGGECAATLYSLIESCRRVDVDPFLYLRDVLVRVCTHPASLVHELLPAHWRELFGSAATR
jgi:hypothetical protein